MSALTSPSSPRSGQNSDDLFEFDGADELSQAWRDGLKPDPALTVSQWADTHRCLSPRASAEPGRYRTDRTPYMRAIMDALSPIESGAACRGDEVGAGRLHRRRQQLDRLRDPPRARADAGGAADGRTGQALFAPARRAADWRKPGIAGAGQAARARDAGNTVLSKEFPAGLLVITGANSAVGLRSMPARYLFLDEVDAYPPSADEEGDPVALAEARTRTFSWRSKVLLGSTPTIHGISRIEREYEASDQRRFFVPCPHCQDKQWLRFERLRWDKGKPETTHYICASCDGRIEEHHKTAMLAGRRVAGHGGSADPGTIGFHVSALYSPVGWFSWADIARMWEAADHRRGQAQLQEQRARRDLGRDRRGAGLAAAL